MLAMLSAGYCLAYVDRLMMAVVAEPVREEFGLSDTELFLLAGAAFTIVYGTLGLAMGWMLDRWSRTRVVAASLCLWSACTIACGLAGNFVQLALARASVGAGEAAIAPAAHSLISDIYPPQKRPLAMGIFYAGGMVGILIAWTMGGWVAAEYGWRYAFVVVGPPGIILAALLLWKGQDSNRAGATSSPQAGSTFVAVWQNRPLVWLIGAASVGTFVNVGLVTQLGSFFIRSHNMTIREVGMIFGPVMAVGMGLGLIAGGWLGNRLAQRSTDALVKFAAWNTAALFPLYLLILLAPSKNLALCATFVGTFASVLYAPCFAAAYQTVSATHTRATAAGIANCANALIGGAVTTLLVGALSDHLKPAFGSDSLRYAMVVGLVSCPISSIMFCHARRLIAQERIDLTNS